MMDFLDPKKKRAYNVRLFVGLLLTAIVLLLGTIVLALITAGYGINKSTGKVIQSGLVFINAQPQPASIYINGVLYGQTNGRIELPAGSYNFSLKRSGYHDWNNTTYVDGGAIDQLVYPYLFPISPTVSTVEKLSAQPDVVSETPNRHYLMVSQPGNFGSFNVVDITNPKAAITSFSLPAGVLTAKPGVNNFQLVSWSSDNQHVLLEHTYTGGSEYIMVDWTTPSDSFNVSKTFTVPFTQIRMDNNSFSKLYLYNAADQSLSLGDVSTKAVTPVLSNVLAFWPYGDNQILYTVPIAGSTTTVMAKLYNDPKTYNIRALPVSSLYLLNMASFNGHTYVVVGTNSDQLAYIYQDPLNELSGASSSALPVPYTIFIIDGVPEQITFSASAGYIVMQSTSEEAVYDIQTETHYRFTTPVAIPAGELSTWMDGNRLTLVSNSKLAIYDFDGTNLVNNFTSADSSYLPAFNTAYDAVYTATQSGSGQWQINRTSLVVAPLSSSPSPSPSPTTP